MQEGILMKSQGKPIGIKTGGISLLPTVWSRFIYVMATVTPADIQHGPQIIKHAMNITIYHGVIYETPLKYEWGENIGLAEVENNAGNELVFVEGDENRK